MFAKDELSEDAALGGRLVLRQPLRGHRFGHDSILLGAATMAEPEQHAIELGAGVGAAGLALARRVEGLAVTLVEVDPSLAVLAGDNAARNGLADRVHVICLDATAPAATCAAAGLEPASADHVLMNPPFNAPDNPSPDHARRAARVASPGTLGQWLLAASRFLRPFGTVTLIWRADGLADVLAALAREFGTTSVLPVYSKPAMPAIRVLVRAVKDGSGQLSRLPGLLLADAGGKPTAQAESILRHGEPLSWTNG